MGKVMLCQSVRFTAKVRGDDAVSAPSMAIAGAAMAEAVLVVADATVPRDALDRQCKALVAEGMVVHQLTIGRCRHYHELPSIAEGCAAEIRDWQHETTPRVVTLLVWCTMASPLRVLPLLVSIAKAILVRVYGPCSNRRDGCPDHGVKVMRLAEFEAMRSAGGGLWIGIWHPFVSGRLSRWQRVERMIHHMLGTGEVWFAPLEEIARHILACRSNGTYQPRVDKLPFYDRPVVPRR